MLQKCSQKIGKRDHFPGLEIEVFSIMAGSKVLLCLFINNKFCYTDSVDDEDLCEVPEQLRTLEDMLDLAPEPEDSDTMAPESEPG